MYSEKRCAPRFSFVATAEVEGAISVRYARVCDLSIAGAYLAIRDPFSKGAVIRITIRTEDEFFEADAVVAHSTFGTGMGVMFQNVSPRFLNVLQRWLSKVQKEATEQTVTVPVFAGDPNNVPECVNLLREDLFSAHVSLAYRTVVDQDHKYVDVLKVLPRLSASRSRN